MYIVFDTNVVLGAKDYFFEQKMKRLTSLNRFDEIVICMPEVVKDELIKKYLEETKETLEKIYSIERNNRKIHLFDEIKVKKLSPSEIYEEYKSKLDYILDSQKVEILEYLEDGQYIRDLMKKVIFKKAPFSKKADSYRDCFIWYTILDLLEKVSENDKVVFITENTGEFFNDFKSDLHDDLKSDLNGKSNFIIYNSLDTFLENDIYINNLKIKELKKLDEQFIKYLDENFNNDNNKNLIIKRINEYIDIESEISSYLENKTVLFEKNLPYESYISLDCIFSNIKLNKYYYEKFSNLEGVINLDFEVNIEYTKNLKNPMYDSSFDEPDEEFIYKYGNEGVLEIQFGIYLHFKNPEDLYLDLENILDEGNIELESIRIKVLN